MMRRLFLVSALWSSTVLVALGCCGAAPPASGTPTSATTTATSTATISTPAVGDCGHGPHATTCGAGQTCCAGGMAESYYCASLQPGAMCPPLP